MQVEIDTLFVMSVVLLFLAAVLATRDALFEIPVRRRISVVFERSPRRLLICSNNIELSSCCYAISLMFGIVFMSCILSLPFMQVREWKHEGFFSNPGLQVCQFQVPSRPPG